MLIFAKEDCMSDSMETPRKPVLTAKGKEKAEKYSKRMELTLNLANLGSTLQNTFTAETECWIFLMNSRLPRMLQAVRALNLRALLLKMLHSHMERKI